MDVVVEWWCDHMLPMKVARLAQEKKVAPHFVAQSLDFQKCLATSPLTSVVPLHLYALN